MKTKPQVFESMTDFVKHRQAIDKTKCVGFIPTMGALHQGHASLLEKSSAENDFSVLSIFVNPTQFNDPSDFTNYPKTWESDFKIASECNVDFIITPTFEQMYPDKYRFKISENELSQKFCGASRPGHFDGVLTVVMKLLHIADSHRAYFGEKDFQQLQLIKDMAKSFFLKTEIIGCPTLREPSGLAFSSRNSRLSPAGREKAALISKFIRHSSTAKDAKENLNENGFIVDYVEDYQQRRFVAAFLEGVRLIDNVELK